MFVVVGERINTSRKHVLEAVEERNASYIQDEVKKQVEAGANYIDVNAGARIGHAAPQVHDGLAVEREADRGAQLRILREALPEDLAYPLEAIVAAALNRDLAGHPQERGPLAGAIEAERVAVSDDRLSEIPLARSLDGLTVPNAGPALETGVALV